MARLATVAPDGQPDVVPVGFEFDGRYLYVGGLDPCMRITPTVSWSFNLDGRSFTHDREVVPRRTVHHAADPTGSRSAPRATVDCATMRGAARHVRPRPTTTEEIT